MDLPIPRTAFPASLSIVLTSAKSTFITPGFVIRPVMPLTAGTMGMKFKHFLSVDLFSGLIWAPLYSLPGYYGTKLLLKTSYILEFIAGLLLISILAIVLFKKFSNKSKN